jgi:PST family polysaccharide transporter
MNFIKTSFLSGISTAISFIARGISFKIIAAFLGTNGMFLIGQLKDFLRLGNVLGTFGIENGIVKYTSEYDESEEEFTKIISTSFKINLISALIICLIVLIAEQPFNLISKFIGREEIINKSLYLLILLLSIFSFSIHTCFLAIINGLKKIKLWVSINIIANIISALLLVVLVFLFNNKSITIPNLIDYNTPLNILYNNKINGALYAIIISQIATFCINIILIYFYKPFKISQLFSTFSFDYFKKLSSFSIMAIAGPLCLITATIIIRSSIAKEPLPIIGVLFNAPWQEGINYAGSWEAMWRISAMYLLFLITTFKFYLIPTFSKLNNLELKKEVFKVWKFVVPIIIIITLGIYLMDDIIIKVLLTQEFNLIKEIILFHLLGDVIKINCWVLGNIMISKKQTISFSFFQLEWALVFLSLCYIFIDRDMLNYGFVGVSYAYFITYIIHFTLLNIHFRKLLWIK